MKTLLTALAMTMLIGRALAQDPSANVTTASANDDLKTRLATLEKSVEDARIAATKLEDKNIRERYKSSLTLIRSGLENGTQIENILPSSMQLLTLADITTILTDLNNPTSKTLGTSFSDMAISSASKNLLPKYPGNETENKAVESRFKTIMGAIINNPLVQTLANTNPITGTINTIIQQAGLFQNRTSLVKLTSQQIKDKKDVSLNVNFQGPNGPNFEDKQIEAFYAEIKERVEFYVELNDLNKKHADTIKQLQTDAKVIKRGIRASKTQICKLLDIPTTNSTLSLDAKFDTQETSQMKDFLKEQKFMDAVSSSIMIQEQLPDVLEFKDAVVAAISNYIEEYIKILEKYKNKPNTNFVPSNVDDTIKLLKAHLKSFSPKKPTV